MLKRIYANKRAWPALSLPALFLLIEFFDELHYGVESAALPALRLELGLSYAQIGLLLGLPRLLSTLIEPGLMLLGDTGLRKRLVVGGGLAVLLAVGLTAAAGSFPALLAAFILGYPASGAFVSLSQATLMDLYPGRQPHWMARWTAAGSVGNVVGPLAVAGALALGLSWRIPYLVLGGLAFALILPLARRAFPENGGSTTKDTTDHQGSQRDSKKTFVNLGGTSWPLWLSALLKNLFQALRAPGVLRWVVLLELSDLLLDVFAGYAALYLADSAGATPAQAGLLLALLMAAGLASDLALIPLLDRLPGRQVVRLAAAVAIPVYAAFLLVPSLAVKAALLVVIPFTTLGWYPVLQGELYAAAPGRSGAVAALNSTAGLIGGALVWAVGWAAGEFGLPAAMWLLLLGPLALVLFVPHPPAPAPKGGGEEA